MNNLNIFHGDLRRDVPQIYAVLFAMLARNLQPLRRANPPTEAPLVGDMNHPQMVQDGKPIGKPWENHGKMVIYMENHNFLWENMNHSWFINHSNPH